MLVRWVFLALAMAAAGCATTPSVGSHTWYDLRMQEIETSYELGQVSEDEYLNLKNEVDAIRVDYQNGLRSRSYYYHHYPSPFIYYGHHYRHHD